MDINKIELLLNTLPPHIHKDQKEDALYSLQEIGIEARICDTCKNFMFEGFVIDDGYKHYCSEKCLKKEMTIEEYYASYDNGNGDSYYTKWEHNFI